MSNASHIEEILHMMDVANSACLKAYHDGNAIVLGAEVARYGVLLKELHTHNLEPYRWCLAHLLLLGQECGHENVEEEA